MIPKVAHVVWVGPSPMPELHGRLLASNRRVLEDHGYDLRLWGDSDIDDLTRETPAVREFIDEAYAQKRWAFLSDCLKMLLLVKHGGWVLDADNEVIGSFEPFSDKPWVSGFEDWGGAVHPITAAMGAVPGHAFSKRLLSFYVHRPHWLLSIPNTRWISDMLFSCGMNRENRRQYLPHLDVEIFPSTVFCGRHGCPETVVIHHFSGSWLPK